MAGLADHFSEVREPEQLRGVYIKLSGDQWVLTQRPPERKSRYSDNRYRHGQQASGALVYAIQQVPASVTDAEVVRRANATGLVRHMMHPNNPCPWCSCNWLELGPGKLVK